MTRAWLLGWRWQVLRTSPTTQEKAAKTLQSFLDGPDSRLVDADRCGAPKP